MDEIHLKLTPLELESLATSMDLHIGELEEMIPKLEGLLLVPLKQRMIEITDEEVKLGLEECHSVLKDKKAILEKLEDLIAPTLIPEAKFNG